MTDEKTVNLNPDATAAPAQGQQFGLQRIYLKDASFEMPLGAQAFTQAWEPKINLDLNTKNVQLDKNLFEVTLSLTVNATLGEEAKTAFLAEIHQAGIFLADGFDPKTLHQTLGVVCPNILFPYAREAIDNLVTRGSFPALLLSPVNFEALYVQAMRQAAAQQAAKQGAETPAAE
jgi:preprotein translocase subunit SecB